LVASINFVNEIDGAFDKWNLQESIVYAKTRNFNHDRIGREENVQVHLSQIAHTRSGDKGDTCNIGVIALDPKDYPVLVREVTADRVRAHFGDLVEGPVERFELPNLGALNFLLHQALGGGGTVSLRTDAQGKTFGAALLGLKIEV
jgi:hypothetical protein